MPVHNFEQSEMSNYLAERLDATGEFSQVDVGYKFDGKKNPLNAQSKRHILAVQKPEFSPLNEETRYLVIANADNYSDVHRTFMEKLALASREGVHTVHVIYKFLKDSGDFWRRVIREDQRKPGRAYNVQPAFWKRSLAHLPMKVRNRIRRLTDLEKDLAFSLSGNTLMLYQPDSAGLDEKMLRFWIRKVERYDWRDDVYVEMDRERDPYKSEELADFTLTPMRRASSRYITDRLGRLGRKSLASKLGGTRLLAADFLQLPDFGRDRPVERRWLAELREAYKRGDDTELDVLVNALHDAIDPEEDTELFEAFNGLMEEYSEAEEAEVTEVEEGRRFTVESIPVQSDTKENVTYTVRRITNSDDEAVVGYTCSCPGFSRWRHCKHVDRTIEKTID